MRRDAPGNKTPVPPAGCRAAAAPPDRV